MKRSPIKRQSSKTAARNRQYKLLREAFLKEHQNCGVCGSLAREIHHKAKRQYFMLDTDTWLPVCHRCHMRIESNPEWSREKGYSINKFEYELQKNIDAKTKND